MDIFVCVLLLVIGILLIVKGGDWFVDAASWIAEVSGIPAFIIGATVVSLATTLPEILVSSIAASQGNVEMAVGNAVGSVNCNIALVMALSLIFMPAKFRRKDYVAKITILIVSIAILWGVSANGELNVLMSLIVLAMFVLFMIENIYSTKKNTAKVLTIADTIKVTDYNQVVYDTDFCLNANGTVSGKKKRKKVERKDLIKYSIFFILGVAGIVGGAQLLVTYGVKLAEIIGIPQGIIGVTIIAVGTSLPELVTTVTAIAKKKSDLSVGNIIGANIIDITLILPLCALIAGGNLPVSTQALTLDLPFCMAFAGVAFIPALIRGKFQRWQGVLLIGGYITYLTLLVVRM